MVLHRRSYPDPVPAPQCGGHLRLVINAANISLCCIITTGDLKPFVESGHLPRFFIFLRPDKIDRTCLSFVNRSTSGNKS